MFFVHKIVRQKISNTKIVPHRQFQTFAAPVSNISEYSFFPIFFIVVKALIFPCVLLRVLSICQKAPAWPISLKIEREILKRFFKMHILEMVYPNLKELEGVAQEPFPENRAFIQRNNQSSAGQFGQMESVSSLLFFPLPTPSCIRSFQRDAQQHVLALFYCSVCFVVVFVCHKEIF